MATQRIEIIVTATGAPVVQRNIRDIAAAADRADVSVRLLQRALVLLGGGGILVGLKNYLDTFTNIQNKLRFVTRETESLAGVTNALFEISMRSRSSFEATATLYSRVALATRELAVNQQQLLDFTETLNKATILSGATTIEAYNAIRQLSQGMAKGRLDGDELRSVLEQLPVVADIIAKQMKTVRGELKELGSEGKITPQVILDAFKAAKEMIDKGFLPSVMTIGQAFTNLETGTIRILSEIDRSTGISRMFAEAVNTLALNMDKFAIAVTAAGAALLTYFGPAIITAITRAVAGLFVLLLAHPFMAFAAAIVGAVVAFASLNDVMDEQLKRLNLSVTYIDKLAASWAGAKAYIQQAWADFPDWIGWVFKSAVNMAIDALEWLINDFGKAVAQLVNMIPGREQMTPNAIDLSSWKLIMTEAQWEAGEQAGHAFMGAYKKVLKERAVDLGTVSTTNNPAGQSIIDSGKADKGPTFEGIKKDLWDQIFLLQKEYDLRKKLTEIYQIEKTLKRNLSVDETAQIMRALTYIAALEREATIRDEMNQPTIDYRENMVALSEVFKKGIITMDQYNKKWSELRYEYLQTQITMEAGIERGILKLQKDFADMATLIENSVVNAFTGMEDALVQMVSTGKFSFADLANSIIADLIRIAIRAQITGPLMQAATGGGGKGGGWGNIIGSVIGAFMGGGGGMNIAAGVQSSGAITTPVYGGSNVVGVPLSTGTNRVPYDGFVASLHKDEAVVPAKYNPAAGGSGGGNTIVVQPIIYNNASDKVSAQVETSQDDQGNMTMSVMIDSVERELSARVDRGNSPLLTSMARATGTTPKPRGR